MRIRPVTPDDLAFLEQMLFEAFFWSDALERPPLAEFRVQPEFGRLLAGWGRAGDRGLVAEIPGEPAGAAWYRLWSWEEHSYGFVHPTFPEVALGVAPEFRSRGVGRALLRGLIGQARAEGRPALSLSVDPGNFARQLYESEGFYKVGESGTSWTLLLDL